MATKVQPIPDPDRPGKLLFPAEDPPYFAPTVDGSQVRLPLRGGTLPCVCPNCGRSGDEAKVANVVVAPTWTFIGLLFGFFPYLALRVQFGKKGQFTYSPCRRCATRSKLKEIGGTLLILLGAAIAVGAFEKRWYLAPAGLVLVVGIWLASTKDTVKGVSIDKHGITIKACQPALLAAIGSDLR